MWKRVYFFDFPKREIQIDFPRMNIFCWSTLLEQQYEGERTLRYKETNIPTINPLPPLTKDRSK